MSQLPANGTVTTTDTHVPIEKGNVEVPDNAAKGPNGTRIVDLGTGGPFPIDTGNILR